MSYEIKLDGLTTVPQANIDALLRAHPDMVYDSGGFRGHAIVPTESIAQDIEFTLRYNLPAENTASRLETYWPRNPSQEELLEKATFLANIKGRFMGLVALGDAGVGKTHVAIGLAKQIDATGQISRYVHVPRVRSIQSLKAQPDEVIIIDDLNTPFGWGRSNFANLITEMHHNGSGRLFITSNELPEKFPKFVLNMIGGIDENDPEVRRIVDRGGVALRTVHVTGESFRHQQAEDPWADYDQKTARVICHWNYQDFRH